MNMVFGPLSSVTLPQKEMCGRMLLFCVAKGAS